MSTPWIDELLNDVKRAGEIVRKDDSQFARRMLLRSLITFIEADLYATRQNLADQMFFISMAIGHTNFHLMTILLDQRPELQNNGKITLKSSQESLLRLTKFLVRVCKYLAKSKKDYLTDAGWQSYEKMIDIRNRITHPKSEQNMQISDTELHLVIPQALTWYQTTFDELVREYDHLSHLPASDEERQRQKEESARHLWEEFITKDFPD